MINVSNEFKQALENDNRDFLIYLDITLKDGTVLDTLKNADIWQGGIRIDDGVTPAGQFAIGSCITNKLTVTLNNIYDKFSNYDFDGATVTAFLGLELSGGRIEKINKGVFTVDNPQYNGTTITLECLDNMSKFDVDYAEVPTTYPASLGTIVKDICAYRGVTLNTVVFDNDDYMVESRPSGDGLTDRQVLAYCAQIAGCFGRCDMYGRLEFRWFDQADFEDAENSSAKIHDIHSLSSFSASTDDVVITGIEVTEEFAETEEVKKETFLYGNKGYLLSVSKNEFIPKGIAETVANYLGQRLVGLKFRPMTARIMADPTIEAGDVAYVTDRKGNQYQCLITNLSFEVGGFMSISCDAQTPTKNSAKQYTEMTRAVVEARKNAQAQISEYDQSVQQITQLISQGFGMYLTAVEQEDGGKIYYMHDKPTIEESSYTCYHTSTGIIASLDGGTTWAVDKNGNGLFNVLTARGLNAGWINTGRLVAKDKSGNVMFLVDIDTGEVKINAQSISLGSSNVVTQNDLESAKAIVITLSNESHTISTDSSGNGGDFTDCKTALQVYSGTEDVTAAATYTLETSDGVTGAFDMATHTYSVTGLTEDNGYVDFVVTYNGTTVTKRFTVSKAKRGATGGKGEPGAAGADGRVYILETSDTAIKKSVDNVLTPASITFKGFYRNGTTASRTAYAGRFKIEESTDGSTFAVKYTSSANESSKVYTPSSSSVKVIRCTMYAAGGTTNALDTQSVIVLSDVEGMEVGGKQILRGTASPKLLASGIAYWENGEYRYVSGGDGVGSIEEVLDSPVASATQAFVMKNNTTGNKDFQQTYMPIINGQTYTFSAWVKGSGRLLIRMWHSGANIGQNYLNEVVNATEWTRISGTVIADIPEGTTSTNTQFGVSGACEEMMFIAPKLEVGNIPTDWTPAPEDTASDIKNAVAIADAAQNAIDVSLDVIVGTQTAATGAWTGKAKFSELKDGQQIVYWLPYAGSGNATLNLTLADGTTTGAKNCYYGGTTRITTHYPAGSAIRLVYRKAAAINGSTYEGWWADANYDSGNTYDRTRYSQAVKCGTAAIVAGNVIVGKNGVYQHLKSGASFDITYQILYASQAIAASGTNTWTYVALPFTVTTTQSITLTAYKPVYIKGKLSGTTFTPVSTAPLTQAVPTTADGYHYILLGQAYSATAMYLLPEHPIFMYHNGAFKSFEQIAAEAAAAAENAQNDIDNLQIGGRNLFVNTNNPDVSETSKMPNLRGFKRNVAAGGGNIYSAAEHGVRVTMGSSSVYACYYMNGTTTAGYGHDCFEPGQEYTLSFDWTAKAYSGESATTTNSNLRMELRTDATGTYAVTKAYNFFAYTSGILGTEQSGRCEYTFTFPEDATVAMMRFYFHNSTSGCSAEGDFLELRNMKLEKGNRATDWTPAPEDVQDSIDKVRNDVANMTKTVFSASTPTDTSVLWIDTSQTPPVAKRYNPDTVSWEVVNDTTEIIQSIRQDISSVIDQLPDRIDMSVKEQTYLKGEVDTLMSELKTMLETTKDSLDITISRLEGNIEDTSGKLDKVDFAEYATYFNFRESGMYIGKSDSVFKLRLINDRISFLEGDVEVAYISNRKLYITDLEITGSLMIGDFGSIQESNGSLSFGKIR